MVKNGLIDSDMEGKLKELNKAVQSGRITLANDSQASNGSKLNEGNRKSSPFVEVTNGQGQSSSSEKPQQYGCCKKLSVYIPIVYFVLE